MAKSTTAGLRHSCMYPPCSEVIPTKFAMCRTHWRLVPRDIQRRVWAAYGQAPGSAGHDRALQDAIGAVDAAMERLMGVIQPGNVLERAAAPQGRLEEK